MRRIDEEIRAVEARIARERGNEAGLLNDCGETARGILTARDAC
jgi:hypothetical protein